MNIISCKNCGVVMDLNHVDYRTEYPDFKFYICPACKIDIDDEGNPYGDFNK